MNQEELKKIYSLKSPNVTVVKRSDLGPDLTSRVTEECKCSDSWHKFMVQNVETLTRDIILKTIIDFVHPLDLFPVCFLKGTGAIFLARYCVDAILKLMANNLMIQNPINPSKPLHITIVINQVPGDMVKIDFLQPTVLSSILKRRYNAKGKCLDLTKFHTDPGLKEFCLLSQPKLMLYVLQYAFDIKQPLSRIILCHNFLKTIEPIRVLGSLDVRSVDLRHNDLPDFEALEPLQDLKKLAILKLDSNPLCDLYSDADYTSKLKQLCPGLEMIDNIPMFHPNGFIVPRKNFLCNVSGGDLVNQFIEHFFTVYDFEDRTKIADLYHKDALFSVTATLIPNQNSTSTARLTHYRTMNRNMLFPTNCFNSKDKCLYRGVQNIMKLFKKLPQTVHDPLQFQCDLIYYTRKQAILVVNGVFQEASCKLGFNRTFVLKRELFNVFTIVNDQLAVYNAIDYQLRFFQKFPENVEFSQNPLPYYNRQYWELREAVRAITNLNYDYSQRFLEAYHYDLKSVISNFLKLYTKDEIPREAFIEPRTELMLDPKSKKKPPLPQNLIKKTEDKFEVCTLCTAWLTINEDRLLTTLKVTDPTSVIKEIMHKPSNSDEIEIIEIADDSDDEQNDEQVSENAIVNAVPGSSQGTNGEGIPGIATPAIVGTTSRRRQGIMSKRNRSFTRKKMRKNKMSLVQSGIISVDLQKASNPQQPGADMNKVVTPAVTKPLQPVQPIQSKQPIQPKQPTQPVRPIQPKQPTQPVRPIQPVQPIQTVKPIQSTQPTQTTQPVQSLLAGKVNQNPPISRPNKRRRRQRNQANNNVIKQ